MVDSYNDFQRTGTTFDFDKLIQLREFMYHKGTDREILFCDVLVAVIYLKYIFHHIGYYLNIHILNEKSGLIF